jgi:hypothetical protein
MQRLSCWSLSQLATVGLLAIADIRHVERRIDSKEQLRLRKSMEGFVDGYLSRA